MHPYLCYEYWHQRGTFSVMLSSNTHKLKMFQFCLPSKNSIILHTYIQLHEHPPAKDCEHVTTVIYTEYFAVFFALLSQPLYLKFSQSVLVCCAVICFGWLVTIHVEELRDEKSGWAVW